MGFLKKNNLNNKNNTKSKMKGILKDMLMWGYEKPYLKKKSEYPSICLQKLIDTTKWNKSEQKLVDDLVRILPGNKVTIDVPSKRNHLQSLLDKMAGDVELYNSLCQHIMNKDNFQIMKHWNSQRKQLEADKPSELEEYNEIKDSFLGSKYEKWPVFKMDDFEEIECTINKEQEESEKKERKEAGDTEVETPTNTLKDYIKQDYWPVSGRPYWYWKAALKPIMRGMLTLEDMEDSLNKLQDNWSGEGDSVKQNLRVIKQKCMEKMYDKLDVLRIKNQQRHQEFRINNNVETTAIERKRLALLKKADVDEYEFDIASKEVEWNMRMLDIIEKEIDELEQGNNDFDLKCAELGPDMDKNLKKWRNFRKIIQENNKDCLNPTRIKQLRIMKNVINRENNKVYNNIDAVKETHNKDIQQTLAKAAVVAGMFALVIGGKNLLKMAQGGSNEDVNYNPSKMDLSAITIAGINNVAEYNDLLKNNAIHPKTIPKLEWETNGIVISETDVINYHEFYKNQGKTVEEPETKSGTFHDNLRQTFTKIIENIRAIALVNNFEEIKAIQRSRAETFTTAAMNTLQSPNKIATWYENIILMNTENKVEWTVLHDPKKTYDSKGSTEYLSAYRFTTSNKSTQAQLMIFPANQIDEMEKLNNNKKDEVILNIPTFEIGRIEKRIDSYFFLPKNGVEKELKYDETKPSPFGEEYTLTGMVSTSTLTRSRESSQLPLSLFKGMFEKTNDNVIHAPNKDEKVLLRECKKQITEATNNEGDDNELKIRSIAKKYIIKRVNGIMQSNKKVIKKKTTANVVNSSTFDGNIDALEVYSWSEWYLYAKKTTFNGDEEKDVIASLSDTSRPSTQWVRHVFEKARAKAMEELQSNDVDEGMKWSMRGFLDFTNLYHYINPQTNVSKIVFRIPMMNSSRVTPSGQLDTTYTVATRGEPILTQIPKKNCVPLTFGEWALVGIEWIWDLLPQQMKEVVKTMAREKYLACKNAKEGSSERWWCIAYSAMAGAAAAVTVQKLFAGNDPMNYSSTGIAVGIGGVLGGIIGYGELYGEENGPGWRKVKQSIDLVKNGVNIIGKTRANIKKAIGKKIFRMIKDTFGEKYANVMVVSIYGQHVDIHSIVQLYNRRGAMLQQIRRELDLLWEEERKKIDHFEIIQLFDKFFTEQIGQSNIKNEMLELYFNVIRMETETPKSKPKLSLNYQFVGNPGTGKTTVAKKVCRVFILRKIA